MTLVNKCIECGHTGVLVPLRGIRDAELFRIVNFGARMSATTTYDTGLFICGSKTSCEKRQKDGKRKAKMKITHTGP